MLPNQNATFPPPLQVAVVIWLSFGRSVVRLRGDLFMTQQGAAFMLLPGAGVTDGINRTTVSPKDDPGTAEQITGRGLSGSFNRGAAAPAQDCLFLDFCFHCWERNELLPSLSHPFGVFCYPSTLCILHIHLCHLWPHFLLKTSSKLKPIHITLLLKNPPGHP